MMNTEFDEMIMESELMLDENSNDLVIDIDDETSMLEAALIAEGCCKNEEDEDLDDDYDENDEEDL